MGNEAQGSIKWEVLDLKNIHLTTWDKEKRGKSKLWTSQQRGPSFYIQSKKVQRESVRNCENDF